MANIVKQQIDLLTVTNQYILLKNLIAFYLVNIESFYFLLFLILLKEVIKKYKLFFSQLTNYITRTTKYGNYKMNNNKKNKKSSPDLLPNILK